MDISVSQTIFPSYNSIITRLLQQQTACQQRKIAHLKAHLQQLNSTPHYKLEPHQINQNILSRMLPTAHNPIFKDARRLEPAHRYQVSGQLKAESLNFYIRDDGEAKNNYQTLLKFRKKALERDLSQDKLQRYDSSKQDRKQEELFKSLYKNSECVSIIQSKFTLRVKSANKQPQEYYKRKANTLHLPSSSLKTHMCGSKKAIGLRKKTIHRAQPQKSCYNQFERNKKFLTDNYLQVLKKLQNTNIVKWRVLNE